MESNTTEVHLDVGVEPFWIGYIFIFESVLIITSNTAVIAIIVKASHLLRKLHNLYLLTLLISHVFVGLTAICLDLELLIVENSTHYISPTIFLISKSIHVAIIVYSFVSVVLVTLDRFLAVKFPFLYEKITKRVFAVSLLVGAILPISCLVLSLIGLEEMCYTVFVLASFVVVIVLIVSNGMIYILLKKEYAAITKTIVTNRKDDYKHITEKLKKRQCTSVKLCLIIVLSFVICWLPTAVNIGIIAIVGYDGHPLKSKVVLIRTIGLILSYGNSIIDPITYVLLNRGVRKEIRKSFRNSQARPNLNIRHSLELTVSSSVASSINVN